MQPSDFGVGRHVQPEPGAPDVVGLLLRNSFQVTILRVYSK